MFRGPGPKADLSVRLTRERKFVNRYFLRCYVLLGVAFCVLASQIPTQRQLDQARKLGSSYEDREFVTLPVSLWQYENQPSKLKFTGSASLYRPEAVQEVQDEFMRSTDLIIVATIGTRSRGTTR